MCKVAAVSFRDVAWVWLDWIVRWADGTGLGSGFIVTMLALGGLV